MLRLLLVSLLLLLLLVALGTEVAALRHKPQPAAGPLAAPVVVRKSSAVPAPRRSVHAVRHRAG
ncbi:MAG: hypothetical protein M3Y12_14855 [Bacteroidota bacterium]|nr:hypothetical protein [Bacteroidota bacterium]